MIELNQVSKTFKTADGLLRAVSDVSIEIEANDIFGIIGFSGAGKSTLLRTINLLERPDAGSEVFVEGRPMMTLNHRALRTARHSIGMIFQHFNLLSNRTVAENVALPLEIVGRSSAERRSRVAECLDVLGIEDKASVYPAKLSGGQKQRVAIARAIANEPRILLCDEPTSAVDPETKGTILNHLKDINRRFGITIVIVTHEMAVVNGICNRVAVMERGRVVEQFSFADRSFTPQSNLARHLWSDRAEAVGRAERRRAAY